MNQATSFSLATRSNKRSMAYAFDARGSLCSPVRMREMVPCGIPVAVLMADCVQPIFTREESFSDVFMTETIRNSIGNVNTPSHYLLTNNGNMDFKGWLQAEMDARKIGPSELARMSRVPQPTIFRILSGETKDPRIGTVKRIERALGIQSPALEAPGQHHELISAWELLTQDQRQQFIAKIMDKADENKAIIEQLSPPEVRKRTVLVAERRTAKANHIPFEDRRKKNASQ